MNITVTDTAITFLKNLIETQNLQDPKGDRINILLQVDNPGTPRAEVMLSYLKESEKGDRETINYDGFDLYVDAAHEKYLDECILNHDVNDYGGSLTIKAPNSKVSRLDENSTLEEKVNYYLINDINPMLAMHGGQVQLYEITEDKQAVLQFGGGCQGCSAVDVTLTQGIQELLLEKLPEITGVLDMTDHSMRENAYYQGAY